MKKNDKLIVLFGVVILVMASIGVYYWAPEKAVEHKVGINQFFEASSVLSKVPDSVTVSDKDPFYALIATPLAVHYSINGEQEILPLYVENFTNPSTSIDRVKNQLDMRSFNEYRVDDSKSAREVSLDVAQNFWESSEAALLIENDESGYCLGVMATPLASYMRIPVIVTDKLDPDVTIVLTNLGVKYTMVCGENIEGYGDVLRFNSVEEIVDATIKFLHEKFGDINYVTLINPIDAWPPKVLDSKEFSFGPETIKSKSVTHTSAFKSLVNLFIGGSGKVAWKFTIPDDYKYALIELNGFNHEIEDVDTFGDTASFSIDPVGGGFTLGGGSSTAQGIPIKDEKGNILEDRVHNEIVLYDCGGKSYILSATGSWALKSEGKVSANIIIKKLENPIYPMMKSLSAIAPYLTSYHKGIIFGKPEFAFAANDEVITEDGKTCPGFYLPGRNPTLLPMYNKHIYDNIHEPLNELLAKLAGIPYDKQSDLKYLTEYYKNNPMYIALVGDATVLPRLIYQDEAEPIGDINGDGIDDTVAVGFGGGGTDSDNIYGDIDPVAYDWANQARDIYSEYPYLENIVGRITGWDVQDADALVVRTIFYDKIIEKMSEWKDNFGNLNGGGTDFQKPLWVQVLNHIPGLKQILNIICQATATMINFAEGPWKFDTGAYKITAKAIENKIGKDLGFEVKTALDSAAMIDGYSNGAIDQIKNINLWKKLTFSKSLVKKLAGEGNVKGRDILENSNFIWITGHGCPYVFGMDGPDLVTSGFDGVILNAPNLWHKIWKNLLTPFLIVGFSGPGAGLGNVGEYSPRRVSTVDFGPSFMWLESCTCGKITGIYPQINIGQAFIHSGVNALIASTTGSNIPGGYLEPKNHMYDTKLSTYIAQKQWEKKAEQGVFPDFHFGSKIYNDLCHNLKDNNVSLGRAFRDAKNVYLPEDAAWELWWSPPLSSGPSSYGPHLSAKYTSFNEYVLYGDPAFIPYVPNGQ